MKNVITILDAVEDPNLFGTQFDVASWRTWLVALKALFGLSMTETESDAFRRMTRRDAIPTQPARELWAIGGRRCWPCGLPVSGATS